MELEQKIIQGQIGIGKDTVSFVFGEEMNMSEITEDQLQGLGELIEDIGLRKIKRV